MPEAIFAAAIGIGISLMNRYALPQLDGFWLENCAREKSDASSSDGEESMHAVRTANTTDEEAVASTTAVNQDLVCSSSHVVEGH